MKKAGVRIAKNSVKNNLKSSKILQSFVLVFLAFIILVGFYFILPNHFFNLTGYDTYDPNNPPFSATWNTSKTGIGSSAANMIVLPITGTYSVDWGDGTSDNSVATHTYSAPGVYRINITNLGITGFRFNNAGDKLKIIDIYYWGNLKLGNSNSYFWGCANLNSTGTIKDNLNLTGTTDLSFMFEETAFNGNILGWNTGKVINMYGLFQNARAFNQDINAWNTGNVTNMGQLFYWASTFNRSLNNWDTSKVTTMVSMFYYATNFNGNISSWDTSKVTDMNSMFMKATNFNQPIGSWNTGNVTKMVNMFYYAYAFNQPIGSWNTSKVTNMNHMFAAATSFNQSLNNWNTSKVTTMTAIFESATNFNGNIIGWDTSKVTSMDSMFGAATNFNQPIDNWNTSSVTSMGSMFASSAFNQNISSWETSKVTTMSSMFNGATNFNQSLNNWNTSKVTNMYFMFASARSFNQPLNNWDVSKVTTMQRMFQSAVNFSQNLSAWDTSKVTNMNSMFYSATNFNQPLDSWDTSKVTDMSGMFLNASNFNYNLRNWNVSSLTYANYMFQNSNLSVENYDALLNGWAGRFLKNNTIFSAGTIKYSSNASANRSYIINNFNWTITDGGLYVSVSAPIINQVIAINQTGILEGTMYKGDNVKINATITNATGSVSKVWIKVWQNIIGGPILLSQYLTQVIGNLWSITFATNASFNLGQVNYTIFANESSGLESNFSGNFTLLLGEKVYECGVLNISGITYVLQNNVSSSGSCFNITANNVTLDCVGYLINYSQSVVGYGVTDTGYNNTVIRNCRIEQGSSVALSSDAVYFSNTKNEIVENNIIIISRGGSFAINLASFSSNSTIQNNNITISSGTGSYGVYLQSNSNSTIQNNNITTFGSGGYGIYLYLDSNSNLKSNNIVTRGNTTHGVLLDTSLNITLNNNNITTNGSLGYGINLVLTTNSTLLNNQITTGSKAIFDDASGTGNLLIYNNLFGEIKWVNDAKGFLNNLTTMGNITFPGTIAIKYNSVFVNSSYFYNQKINSSADIILYGIDVIRPVILRDAAPCGINCINSTSLNSEIVKFRINSWSEYGIGETFYCEDGICNNGETCSSCSGDCGSCPVVNSGSGGGGGSSNTGTSGCKANWTCSLWSACSSYKIQTRVCMDALKCNNLTGKPVESQACVYTGANETIVTGENKSNENLVSANNAASLNDNNFFIKFWPYLLMVLVLILLSSVIVFILFQRRKNLKVQQIFVGKPLISNGKVNAEKISANKINDEEIKTKINILLLKGKSYVELGLNERARDNYKEITEFYKQLSTKDKELYSKIIEFYNSLK